MSNKKSGYKIKCLIARKSALSDYSEFGQYAEIKKKFRLLVVGLLDNSATMQEMHH